MEEIKHYFKKMDPQSVNGKKLPVHCRGFYLEKIAYIERPRFATSLEVASALDSINRGSLHVGMLDDIVCYFEHKSTHKTTQYFTFMSFVPEPVERIAHLAFYCMYNHGLNNLSVYDLAYIYSWLI